MPAGRRRVDRVVPVLAPVLGHPAIDRERPLVHHRGREVDARQLVRAPHRLEVGERVEVQEREQGREADERGEGPRGHPV